MTSNGRVATPTLARAQPLREVLATPVLAGSAVLAGAQGLDRPVERLNVMEVPDILPWVKPRELLLTTAYPLRGRSETLTDLVAELDKVGLAGLGVKLGRYLDELPAPMLVLADRLGFPIVRLPEDVSFDDIFDEVLTGLLNRQARKLARSEEIHRAFLQLVLRGGGLEEIAADLAALLDGPAAIIAEDGTVLATARLDQPLVDRLVLDGDGRAVRCGDHRIPCVTMPVSAGTTLHGHVVALGAQDPLGDDALALENAATVTALVIAKQLEVAAVESKYQADLLHDLLRRATDRDDALRRARTFGWDLERPLEVIVLRHDDPQAAVGENSWRVPLATAVGDTVRSRDPQAAIVRFTRELVVLTGAFNGPDARKAARTFADRLVAEALGATGCRVSAGLSRPVSDVDGVADGYEQAAAALAIGRRVHGDGAVAHFDDLGAYRLLSLIDDAELASFASDVLGPLAADDHGTADLRHTLQVLLAVGGNVAEAARRLHFHYNTMRYRIDKLTRMLGPFTDDARLRLDLHLALLIHDMRGLRRPR